MKNRTFSSYWKNKTIKSVAFLVFCTLFSWQNAIAQESRSNKKELDRIANSYKSSNESARKKAYKIAAKKNWITFKVFEDGKVMSLQSIDAQGHPLYLVTDNNSYAAATTRANKLYNYGGLGLNLSGSSTFLKDKIGEWDGGAVYGAHQEFTGDRVLNKDAGSSISQHATHVAGTIMAAGINSNAKGMAFGLQRLAAHDFNNDDAEMAVEAGNNMLISNHSYGFIAGWNYNSAPSGGGAARWEWHGIDGSYEDYKFGFYDGNSQSWDNICYQAPYYLPVKSSGNNRGETGPAIGQAYWKQVGGTWTQFTRQAGDLSSNDSYDCISLSGNAKNILTVGAINGLPNGPFTPNAIQISSFSSYGPTDDGRIKPDVVGMGVSLTSTIQTSPTAYGSLSGTSMSAPNVTGTLVLLQEAYAQQNNGAVMRSATLKGLAIHTADDAGNAGPDYIYGWGLVNAEKAAKVILGEGTTHFIEEHEVVSGSYRSIPFVSSGTGPLVATICWTDPPGVSNTSGAINERTPRLVNDLDLRISDGTTTFRPFILDPDQPQSVATTGDNYRDNVEQIIIPNALPGKNYNLIITHKGTQLSGGKQTYSLIVSGIGGASYCASGPTSTNDSKITSFSLANFSYTATPGACTSYTDLTNQIIEVEAGATYNGSIGLGTCQAAMPRRAKVYIDFNCDGQFDEQTEMVRRTGVAYASNLIAGLSGITIPANVPIGNTSLLRIVLSETTDENSISACGSYSNGETLDISIKFNTPSKDVGVSAIINPISGSCATNNQKVTLTVKNMGSASVSNVGATVRVYNGTTLVSTLGATYDGSIAAGGEANMITSTGFNSLSSTNYTIEAETTLSGDLNATNNLTSTVFSTSTPPSASSLLVTKCENESTYTFTGSSGGTIFWYKNAADALPIAFNLPGQSATYTESGNTIPGFYAAVNDVSGSVGPATNTVFSSGGYLNGNNPSVLMRANAPVVLESARLYIGSAGRITFVVTKTATSAEVSRVTIDVAPPGQVYPLNLLLPEAGDYSVSIEYANGASIYRNNSGVSGYPFKLGDVFSITGNTASDGTNPNYYQNFYYYFYDLAVRSAGCTNGQRTLVTTSGPIAPSITANGNLLTSSASSGNQWYYNGALIAGATGTTYTANVPGSYTVKLTAGNCTATSATTLVGVSFPLPHTNFTTTVVDETCRASNNGSITINAVKPLSYTATVTANGQTTTQSFVDSYSLTNLQAGTYAICITADGNTSYKICYSVVVKEPQDLAVLSQINPVTNSISLSLDGATTYYVEVNGEQYQTSSSDLTLPLKIGDNSIRVSTDKVCQGVFEQNVLVNEKAVIYPNPFTETVFIKLAGNQSAKVKVSMTNSSGTEVYKQTFENTTGTLQLNVSNLESGFYFLSVGGQTYKLFKK